MMGILSLLHTVIWEYILIYLLIAVGMYFTMRLRFIQLKKLGHMFALLRHSRLSNDRAGISSFQALCTTLAARVGTGNLAGVAIAIYLGGPGAIFWMCATAFLGMATSVVECTLAQLYKVKDQQGNYRGGPAYYIEKGLGLRWLGVLFSIFLIIAFGLVFNAVQSHSIGQAMRVAFGFQEGVTGLVIMLVAALIVFGGIRGIARFVEIIVPFMAIGYVALALIIVLMNISQIPAVGVLIIQSAFGWQEAGAGVLGYSIAQAIMHGVKRGLFSNEAGMGSAPNAAATATPYPKHPAAQGYLQMLGVFVDTLVICMATAAIILFSGQFEPGSNVTGIELTQRALSYHVGGWGGIFIAIAILFFAFTSIVANYAYAENNLVFIYNHKTGLFLFRLCFLGMVMVGSISELPVIWTIADVSMGLMAIVNLIAIVFLSGIAIRVIKDYDRQITQGLAPTFDVRQFPELINQLEQGIWYAPDTIMEKG